MKQAWDFLEDLVACEKALVKIFGPMSTTTVTGLMKQLIDAIDADNGTILNSMHEGLGHPAQ